MLFLNMGLKMLCLVLFESSDGIFERLKQLVCTANKEVLLTHTSPFGKMLKIRGLGDFELSCSFYPKEAMRVFPRASVHVKRF